jgi:DNA-binding HxlR family transcriptional regulator
MTGARRYDDPCGVARALDVIGDRWALLVVRELLFGPRRFVQLRDGLGPVSPNVLAQRLRDLESAGVVRRDLLDPPASVAVYDLTPRGRALEPVLLALGRWGSQEPAVTAPTGAGPVTAGHELSASALLLALKTVFDPAAAVDASIALGVNGDWFELTITSGTIGIRHGRARQPDASIAADVPTLRRVAFGRQPLADAERDGSLVRTGDRELADRFTRMFPVPADRPTP